MIAAHLIQRPALPRSRNSALLHPRQRQLLAWLCQTGGATSGDLVAAWGITPKDACNRLQRLKRRGLIASDGVRPAGRRGGRPGRVWQVAQ